MKESKFLLRSPNGDIRGNFLQISETAPCVLLCCGHNGFYHFGFFPSLQQTLAKYHISSVAFNYTHCGITDDGDVFNDLEAYERNCRQLESEDIYFMACELKAGGYFGEPEKVILLAHSMGGVSATFAMKNYLNDSPHIDAMVLLCAMKTLDLRTNEIMNEWMEKGVFYRTNSRTNQELPQGAHFLDETLLSNTTWNVQAAIETIEKPILIAHSDKDESVPFEHGEALFDWVRTQNTANVFLTIPDANHTLNTSHIGERDSKAVQFFAYHLVEWLDKEIL
jgi:uncharacterized protein